MEATDWDWFCEMCDCYVDGSSVVVVNKAHTRTGLWHRQCKGTVEMHWNPLPGSADRTHYG